MNKVIRKLLKFRFKIDVYAAIFQARLDLKFVIPVWSFKKKKKISHNTEMCVMLLQKTLTFPFPACWCTSWCFHWRLGVRVQITTRGHLAFMFKRFPARLHISLQLLCFYCYYDGASCCSCVLNLSCQY